MAFNYEKAARTAYRLLTRNGRPVQLVKLSRAAADPNRPWRGSGLIPDEEKITATVVFVDPVSEKDLGRKEVVGPDTAFRSGTQIGFIAAKENPGVDLTKFNRMVDHDLVWNIDEIHAFQPGKKILIYELRVSR